MLSAAPIPSGHDPWGTSLHLILLVTSIWEFVLLYWLAATPLRGAAQGQIFPRKKAMVGAVLSSGILTLLSVGAIYGLPSYFSQSAKAQLSLPLATAHLEEENISTKPPNWAVQHEQEEDMAKAIEAVQGAQLEGRNLRGMNTRRAF